MTVRAPPKVLVGVAFMAGAIISGGLPLSGIALLLRVGHG